MDFNRQMSTETISAEDYGLVLELLKISTEESEVETKAVKCYPCDEQGLSSVLQVLQVDFVTRKIPSPQSISFIIKQPIENNSRISQYFHELDVFNREAYIYQVLTQFEQTLRKQVKFPIPKFIHGVWLDKTGALRQNIPLQQTANRHILVLERLEPFTTVARHQVLDRLHMMVAVKTLGEFHALGRHLCQSTRFRELKAAKVPLTATLMTTLTANTKRAASRLRSMGLTSIAQYVHKLADANRLARDYQEIFSPVDPRALTLVHGDLWSGNIMFSYKGDRPLEARFIDFQLSQPGSISADLLYMLYTSGDSLVQDPKHLQILLAQYVDSYNNQLPAINSGQNRGMRNLQQNHADCYLNDTQSVRRYATMQNDTRITVDMVNRWLKSSADLVFTMASVTLNTALGEAHIGEDKAQYSRQRLASAAKFLIGLKIAKQPFCRETSL